MWEGNYADVSARWLRWATPDGTLPPTGEEIAEQERRRAQESELSAEELEATHALYRQRFGEMVE